MTLLLSHTPAQQQHMSEQPAPYSCSHSMLKLPSKVASLLWVFFCTLSSAVHMTLDLLCGGDGALLAQPRDMSTQQMRRTKGT